MWNADAQISQNFLENLSPELPELFLVLVISVIATRSIIKDFSPLESIFSCEKPTEFFANKFVFAFYLIVCCFFLCS